jgi:hypothetical protein
MLSLFTVVFSDDSTSLFCVNPTYYFQINYSFVWAHNFNNNCFHYSETSDQQGEITLTDNQINQIVSASDQLTQQPSTVISMLFSLMWKYIKVTQLEINYNYTINPINPMVITIFHKVH